jgi:FtsZ-interacting cell division protein ZipA
MSDLQLSLIVVGLLVIAGVYLFNRMQERRYRRKFEEVVPERVPDEVLPVDDVLPADGAAPALVPEAEEEPRIEPSFAGEARTSEPELPSISQEPTLHRPEPASADAPATSAPMPAREPSAAAQTDGPDIDYRAELVGGAPLRVDIGARLEKQLGGIGKPIRMEGREGAEGPWRPLPESGTETTGPVRIAMQLADRGGPVSAAQLARFREIVEVVAAELGATVEFDDEAVALAKAAELDGFCADNDVEIGLNIIPGDVTGLAGTKLRALAESSGFTLTAAGAFQLHDDRGVTLIALASMDGVPLEAGSLKHLRSQGVTLLIDVARAPDGRQAFRRMTELARHFANALNGAVVDDKRTPLSAASLEKIANQIDAIQGALKARGIAPGGPLALRLFS